MRKVKHILRFLLLLVVLAMVAGIAYMYLIPMIRSETVMTYDAYVVRQGSIATEKSFSASISVASSETHQNTSRATSIREIYVKNGQTVRKDDKLMLLDNGELLRAGLNGTVTEMRFDTTDWLWNNVNLIQISDLTHLKVSLSVDEYDVRNVAAGQKCLVTIVPTGQVFETEIAHVDRVSASSGQVAAYTATAELAVPENVLPGMTASVSIPSDSVTDVLVLDMAALAFDEEKQPYVLLKNDTGYERTPVEIGLSDGMQVEIVAGLNEGDTVWAAAGTETAENPYTLTELYKKVFGEKVVVNDMTGSGQGGRNGFPGMQMPGGMSMPAEGGNPPERLPAAGQMEDKQPETDMSVFDAPSTMPSRDTQTKSEDPAEDKTESEKESSATEAPQRRERERKEMP